MLVKTPTSARETTRPLLKWAGGKTQLLGNLLPKVPKSYGRYIEPFFGGGALYFSLMPDKAIIADSNPELVNLYTAIANDAGKVIKYLSKYKNTEECFYLIRDQIWKNLHPFEAAARTIFLNRTCFNGLYRVNRLGQFNVPFGRYKNPRIIDEEGLFSASILLRKSKIICADYKKILSKYAKEGDFIFLDPPYLPVSEYADFKRYTKEQFYEEDHVELANEILRLHNIGCHVVLTNSNHPLVHQLYGKFEMDIVKTRRQISCNAKKRIGEDVIVTIPPKKKVNLKLLPSPLIEQVSKYPSTRFMGSKNKLLTDIWAIASQFEFNSVIDLFSGSGIVSYMFKSYGKRVISNDYMAMSATLSKAMIENNKILLPECEAKTLLKIKGKLSDSFVQETFKDLYFSDEDNYQIDIIRHNIKLIKNQYKRSIAMSALIRACVKKRPRGIFTYVGHRYDDGRRDLTISFQEQFMEAVEQINNAIFDNGKNNKSRNGEALSIKSNDIDLAYIDPPYYSPFSDNEYVRRYHFVEGLARDWEGVEIQEHTSTKKFKSYPTPFSSKKGASKAFNFLFKKFKNSILIVSYSSNSLPTLDEMIEIMTKYKQNVEVIPVNYKYSMGNQKHKIGNNKNDVQEYIFVGY